MRTQAAKAAVPYKALILCVFQINFIAVLRSFHTTFHTTNIQLFFVPAAREPLSVYARTVASQLVFVDRDVEVAHNLIFLNCFTKRHFTDTANISSNDIMIYYLGKLFII